MRGMAESETKDEPGGCFQAVGWGWPRVRPGKIEPPPTLAPTNPSGLPRGAGRERHGSAQRFPSAAPGHPRHHCLHRHHLQNNTGSGTQASRAKYIKLAQGELSPSPHSGVPGGRPSLEEGWGRGGCQPRTSRPPRAPTLSSLSYLRKTPPAAPSLLRRSL